MINKLKTNSVLFVCLILTCTCASAAFAQSSNSVMQREFIRSSSPLSNGQQITSSYLPGQNQPPQVRVELANSYTPIQNRGVVQTTYQPQYQTRQVVDPYAPRVSQYGQAQYGQTVTAYQIPADQRPTLGIGPISRTGYVNNCGCGVQSTANYVPVNNLQTGAAVSAPPATFGSQPQTFGMQPTVGNGPYRPIITLRNLPPGTYIGQGIVGQPKAYVDGQPMRNFIRYISP